VDRTIKFRLPEFFLLFFLKNYVLKASGVLWLKTLRNDSELG